jgi:ATP-dependent RNA helicase RhlE
VRFSSKEQKVELLRDMLQKPGFEKVIVFGQTKFGVQRLAEKLGTYGIPAEAIHGNKSQGQRQRALEAFKKDRVRVLVATDVAARGLDIPDVSHVINFDQPATYEDYVHRIGRTGRAGKAGQALTFVQN